MFFKTCTFKIVLQLVLFFEMGIPNNIPVGPSNGDNPNSNEHYSEIGMVETVCINLTVFVAVMGLFEANRFYKQIYLKRLQNRFKVKSSRDF